MESRPETQARSLDCSDEGMTTFMTNSAGQALFLVLLMAILR